MNIKLHALLFTAIVVVVVFVTNGGGRRARVSPAEAVDPPLVVTREARPFSFYSASLDEAPVSSDVRRVPARNWEVLDPTVSAQAVLVQSLDDSFPFYHYNTYTLWPTASLTKFLTAVVVLEDIGADEKVIVTKRAADAAGSKVGLRDGEIYTAEDLLKIMVLASSNDAAIAFEDHVGLDEFVRLINKKAGVLGMGRSIFHDGSGLSDLNQSTANDLLRLVRYIVEKHPTVFQWTRSPSVLVQPVNSDESRVIYNINPLSSRVNFLGGKTGTSSAARENLVTLLSHNGQRLVVIVLGSWDRVRAVDTLLEWIGDAYSL